MSFQNQLFKLQILEILKMKQNSFKSCDAKVYLPIRNYVKI
ncbi:16895_t:CDS:2 [Funneliformis caledonium]|uniref:16895_t:CDS:1 n=1 Tax=Funneliformis caledonium TaxID=1117310 RepID=A0A9N9CNW0_9GLOM|nr:16895_t:CDS:2 [Funneliformis caledonium]